MRQPSPQHRNQPVTTHNASVDPSATLGVWISKLAEQSAQPGGSTLEHAQQVLTNMIDDPALPSSVRDAALTEYIALNDDSDLPAFKAFSEKLQALVQAQTQHPTNWPTQPAGWTGQPDTAAQLQSRSSDMSGYAPLPMPMPMPIVPGVLNFGVAPMTAGGNVAQPFLRPSTQRPVQNVDDLSLPPRDRPMLNTDVSKNVSKMVRHILDNPGLTNDAYADHAVTVGWRTDRVWSAVDLVSEARRQIAYGMSQQKRDLLMGRLKEFASIDSPTGFAKSAAHLMKGVPYNPLSFQALAEASSGFRQAGGTVNQMSPNALIPYLPAKSAPYASALLLKPEGYATSGRVSPQPTGIGVAQIHVQQATGSAVQTPTNQPMQAAEQPVSEPVLKRQRVEGEFGSNQATLLQAPVQAMQQAPVAQPMPSLPLAVTAMPAPVDVQQPAYSPISPAAPIPLVSLVSPSGSSSDIEIIEPPRPS